jgi:UDP-N-acetylmuramoyl-tripeptide--D-alanyl-D-alanine ligase
MRWRKGWRNLCPCRAARALNQGDGPPLTVVDDTYNANPDSVRAAIEVLAHLPAPRTLVLGDMGEVGDHALAFHCEVLLYAHAQGLDSVWCTGAHMAQAVAHLGPAVSALWVPDVDALSDAVRQRVQSGGSVLVKGSRFMRMERVVHALSADGVTLRPGSARSFLQTESSEHVA